MTTKVKTHSHCRSAEETASCDKRLRMHGTWLISVLAIGIIWWQGSMMNNLQDIQSQTEYARGAQLHRAELIIYSAPVALITCAEDRKIVVANPACEKLFGYTPDELIGKEVSMILPPDIRKDHVKMMETAGLMAKLGPDNQMIRQVGIIADGLHKNGKLVKVSIALRLIKYGGKVEFIASFRPASEEVLPMSRELDQKVLPDLDEQRANQQRAVQNARQQPQ